MSLYVPAPQVSSRDKLGLALAGGGFRASLFHIGVLRRMAEMDLLRYVEVISTVSGGSIVGALYVLLLKQRLDRKARLEPKDYTGLIDELERIFVAGVQQNLRTRLFMNPLGLLSVCVSHDNLSRRMGRIYQRYLYRETVDALRVQNPDLPKGGWLSRKLWPLSNLLWPGWIPLRSVQFTPGGETLEGGLEAYNKAQLEATPPGSAVPNFVLNSTALNSAAPFRFSSIEIGDPRLGYFRFDEIDDLSKRKPLLDSSAEDLEAALKGGRQIAQGSSDPAVIALALWWVKRRAQQTITPAQLGQWTRVLSNKLTIPAVEAMCRTNFGRLRQLKLAAWYATEGARRAISGGATLRQHRSRFSQVLFEIEPDLDRQLNTEIETATALGMELIRFALELYYLRSAEAMSPRLEDDFGKISLGTAVCASANFPPVFSPLILLGIYDDLHVSRLGLSDGGVYDNLGITTLIDEGCTHIIASDTGAPFEIQQRASSGYLGMIARLPSILTDDVAEQQHTQLRERRRVSQSVAQCSGAGLDQLKQQYGLKGLAFFSIDSLDPPPPAKIKAGIETGCDREQVARLRTDLDSFGDLEVAALINTGYDHADRFLRAYFPEPPYQAKAQPEWNASAKIPRPVDAADKQRMEQVLRVGQSRLFRSLRLGSLPAWNLTLAIVAVFVFLTRRILMTKVSIGELLEDITARILALLEHPIPRSFAAPVNALAKRMVTRPERVAAWIALVVAALAAYKAWTLLAEAFKRNLTGTNWMTRKIVTFAKWTRAFAPALLLGVGLLPLWIAAAICAAANAGYWLYNGPFLWAARMPPYPPPPAEPAEPRLAGPQPIAPRPAGGTGSGGS